LLVVVVAGFDLARILAAQGEERKQAFPTYFHSVGARSRLSNRLKSE